MLVLSLPAIIKGYIMNLVVDQGNTFCKLAVFKDEELVLHRKVTNSDLSSIGTILGGVPVQRAIISSVSDYEGIVTYLRVLGIEPLLLNAHCKFPIENAYGTPATLGIDRIVAAVGAWKSSPSTTNLIIDIGTCITYDIATPEGGFQGGNIAPGLDMRLGAMHKFTKNLPLLEREVVNNTFGKTTSEAMRNGAQKGIQAEIHYYIQEAKAQYSEISTFLTGGDAPYFEKEIKNGIFAVPNLISLGLLEILKINQ